jgi:hypothetical protein
MFRLRLLSGAGLVACVVLIAGCGSGDSASGSGESTSAATVRGEAPDIYSHACGDRWVTEFINEAKDGYGHWKQYPNLLTRGEFLTYDEKEATAVTDCADKRQNYWTTDGGGDRHVCDYEWYITQNDEVRYEWACDNAALAKDNSSKRSAMVWCVKPYDCIEPGDYAKYGGQ